VEQKNWTHVRKLVGWDRYDTPEAQRALNALYTKLRLFQNLFQPSMKLLRKERRGARLLRWYDGPQTPFERVRACREADVKKVAALERLFRRTDPFVLAQHIGQHLDRVASLRSQPPPPSRLGSRWRGRTFSPRASQARPLSYRNSTHAIGAGATTAQSVNPQEGGNEGTVGISNLGKKFRWRNESALGKIFRWRDRASLYCPDEMHKGRSG